MGTVKTSFLLAGIVLAASAWAGCSSADEDLSSIEGAATDGTKCAVFDQQTGKEMTKEKLAGLVAKGDPVAAKIIAGNSACAGSMTKIIEKLQTTDNKDCNGEPGGLGSFLINEEVAFMKKAEAASQGFRTVIRKDCDGRGENGLLFSASASKAGPSQTGVEMIGRSTDGVFNYYELVAPDTYVFFGDSKDFITNGYECNADGVCFSKNSGSHAKPGNKSGKACASCHLSGGLIMKELASPWLHWTAGFPNGSEDVVKAAKNKPILGEQQIGENLEFNVVRASFDAYNDKRVDWLAEKGVKELLRPVACTLDVNLDSGLGGASLVADQNLGFGFLSMDDTIYKKLKKATNHRLESLPEQDDTAFEFTYPRKGEIDENYAQKLVAKGLIDEKTLANILAVDFTRPVFSAKRCALIDRLGNTSKIDAALAAYAKETAAGKKKTAAKAIADDIPALFGNSIGTKTKDAIGKDLEKFFEACNKRLGSENAADKENAHRDIMTFASQVREKMKSMQGLNRQRLIEDPGLMLTTDSLKGNKNALNPTSCELDVPQ